MGKPGVHDSTGEVPDSLVDGPKRFPGMGNICITTEKRRSS